MKINLYKLSKFLKYIIFLIIVICLITIGGVLYYLYNNLYKTMSYSKKITILQNKVAKETINLGLVKKIEEKYQEKNNIPIVPTDLKDIFSNSFEKKSTSTISTTTK